MSIVHSHIVHVLNYVKQCPKRYKVTNQNSTKRLGSCHGNSLDRLHTQLMLPVNIYYQRHKLVELFSLVVIVQCHCASPGIAEDCAKHWIMKSYFGMVFKIESTHTTGCIVKTLLLLIRLRDTYCTGNIIICLVLLVLKIA